MSLFPDLRDVRRPKEGLARVIANLSVDERSIFLSHKLVDLKHLALAKFSMEPIRVFLSCWDSTTSSAHFKDFELSPTLEEISMLMGLPISLPISPIVRGDYAYLARNHFGDGSVLLLRNGSSIDREVLYSRFIYANGDSQKRVKAICLAIFGDVIFPRPSKGYDMVLLRLLDDIFSSPPKCVVPYVLGEMIRSLNFGGTSKHYYGSCALLFVST